MDNDTKKVNERPLLRFEIGKMTICRFSSNHQRLTVPRMIDQLERKMYQKKRKDVG